MEKTYKQQYNDLITEIDKINSELRNIGDSIEVNHKNIGNKTCVSAINGIISELNRAKSILNELSLEKSSDEPLQSIGNILTEVVKNAKSKY